MPDAEPLITPADQVNPMLTAADVMTPAPRTCSPYSSVVEAVLIFRDADCGVVPVVDAGKPVGVLTDRDVALALLDRPGQGALAAASVGDLMSRGVVSVSSDARLDAVLRAFSDHAVRRVLVVDGSRQLAGLIGFEDLAPHVSDRGIGQVVERVTGQP